MQPPLLKSKLEVTWQAMLFPDTVYLPCMCTKLGQTGLNWPQSEGVGADAILGC